ncbi:MAG TPA: HupE/UreJ family protein [Cyclobacteriaceae bacterium]
MIAFLLCIIPTPIFAHQTPSTIVLLDIKPEGVAIELQLPLGELELAFGHDVSKNTKTLVERLGPQLKEYLMAHIHPMTAKDQPWLVEVNDMTVGKSEQTASGPYQEITVHLFLTPPAGVNTRKFILDYDVIMHQLVTHSALVSIRNDWEVETEQPVEIGVIRVDTKTTLIYPLEINLENGNRWTGFKSMVSLGMQHIKEGTDHLLFLLVLLLPAPLLHAKRKWTVFGGVRYSIVNLLKVVSAFTVGHSITLLAGAFNWFHLPSQPIEILIAVSILISAIHAVKPVFAGREVYVAAGFGLVHGLAFANTLTTMNLDAGEMALSILGFNIGIELMQLFVIALIVPWLIVLSRSAAYKRVRIAGALFSGIAALAWMIERILEQTNPVTIVVAKVVNYAPWIILILALCAIFTMFWKQPKADSQY